MKEQLKCLWGNEDPSGQRNSDACNSLSYLVRCWKDIGCMPGLNTCSHGSANFEQVPVKGSCTAPLKNPVLISHEDKVVYLQNGLETHMAIVRTIWCTQAVEATSLGWWPWRQDGRGAGGTCMRHTSHGGGSPKASPESPGGCTSSRRACR